MIFLNICLLFIHYSSKLKKIFIFLSKCHAPLKHLLWSRDALAGRHFQEVVRKRGALFKQDVKFCVILASSSDYSNQKL